MTDEEKIAEIRSHLYGYVSSNPKGQHADKARQILSALPAVQPSDAISHGPREMTDAQLGIDTGPIRTSGATRLFAPPQKEWDVMHPPHHIQTELEADPLLQEGVGQAMTMPALHLLGMGLSAVGRGLGRTETGRAAKFLADEGLPIKEPGKSFGPTEELDALEHGADPDVAHARELLALKPPHLTMHMGSLGAVMSPLELALRNAAPMAGRAALPLARAGEGLASSPLGLTGSPLLQAVTGRE